MGSFPKDFLFWFQFSIIYWKFCCFGVCKHKLGLRIIRFLFCRYFNPDTSYIFCLKEAHYYIRFGFFIKSTILINIIRTYYILYIYIYIWYQVICLQDFTILLGFFLKFMLSYLYNNDSYFMTYFEYIYIWHVFVWVHMHMCVCSLEDRGC